MLLNVSERANGGFYASERFRKSKWRIFMLLNTSERPKIENNRFCQRHKRKKEKIDVSVNDISMKKRK